jgi:hypothetical protein
MLTDVQALVYSALLTWVMLMTASLARARGWTPEGFVLALGNRADLPPPSPVAGRVIAAAHFAGAPKDRVDLGATIFFWARVAYFGVYLAGIVYLRTALWAVAVAGLAMIGLAAM